MGIQAGVYTLWHPVILYHFGSMGDRNMHREIEPALKTRTYCGYKRFLMVVEGSVKEVYRAVLINHIVN